MTIQFPDVSSYQAGLQIQPGTVFLWARATMGSSQVDSSYSNFRSQAAALGVPFGAYHFLDAGNGSAQADNAFAVVGPKTPLFVDVEPDGTSYPTTVDVNAFVARYRALGGIVHVQYYPKWYADSQHANLASTGLLTINSSYTGYSDTSSNWNSYDGITPFEWQYSSTQSYGGQPTDSNAYKGTLPEYLALIGYPLVAVNPPLPFLEDDDMQQIEPIANHPGEYAYPIESKGHVRFAADGYGQKASLRVAIWEGPAVAVTDGVQVGGGFTDLPLTPLTSAVTVRREDAGDFPVGVSAY